MGVQATSHSLAVSTQVDFLRKAAPVSFKICANILRFLPPETRISCNLVSRHWRVALKNVTVNRYLQDYDSGILSDLLVPCKRRVAEDEFPLFEKQLIDLQNRCAAIENEEYIQGEWRFVHDQIVSLLHTEEGLTFPLTIKTVMDTLYPEYLKFLAIVGFTKTSPQVEISVESKKDDLIALTFLLSSITNVHLIENDYLNGSFIIKLQTQSIDCYLNKKHSTLNSLDMALICSDQADASHLRLMEHLVTRNPDQLKPPHKRTFPARILELQGRDKRPCLYDYIMTVTALYVRNTALGIPLASGHFSCRRFLPTNDA